MGSNNNTWATVADAGPTPEQRLESLAKFYERCKPSVVLREALNYFQSDVYPGTPAIGAPLVKYMVVVCVDTESHTMNTDQMTELGLNFITREKAKEIGPPGAHGYKLQEALRFFHLRVVEHAHLKSNRTDSLGPLGNRFGHTHFATFQELRVILDHFFLQDIETDDPKLKGCKRPVVLVGHALKHDVENTQKSGLDYDMSNKHTVVAKIDTQSLARETSVWVPPPAMHTNEIGLRVLIDKLGFKHLDDHTACNDAARTMMCAIHMILPDHLWKGTDLSMQAVADRVEQLSKTTSPGVYGTVKCCIRCAGRDHSAEECTVKVRCDACNRFDTGPDRERNVADHIETFCPHVARFMAWLRRYKDAAKKHQAKGKPLSKEVLAGPGAEGHPWSTWYGQWPLKNLGDAVWVSDVAKPPKPQVYNLQSALGGLPVPSTGNWVMANATTQSSSVDPAATGARPSTAFPPLPPAPTGAAPTKVTTMSEERERKRAAAEAARASQAADGGSGGGKNDGGMADKLQRWGFEDN